MNRRILLTLSALLVLQPALSFAAPGAGSPTPTSPAERFVAELHERLRAAVKQSADPKQDPKLVSIFEEALDYAYLSTASLGKLELDDAQRARFDDVFRRLVRASYRKNLRDPSSYVVSYRGTTALEPPVEVVLTTTQNKGNAREKPLEIDYRLAKAGAKYLIQDVVTGGVSLVDNYRRQFGKVIRKQGFDKLMELMNERLAELEGKG